jgi:hypothetical protein
LLLSILSMIGLLVKIRKNKTIWKIH